MSLGDMRSRVIEAFEAQTGRKAADAWPTGQNCWTVVDEEGNWHNARIYKEG